MKMTSCDSDSCAEHRKCSAHISSSSFVPSVQVFMRQIFIDIHISDSCVANECVQDSRDVFWKLKEKKTNSMESLNCQRLKFGSLCE